MCGQVGIIFGRKRRRPGEWDYLREVFIRKLLHSEERGPHASGLAWLKTDGSHRIFKRPMRARELVYEKTFQELLGQVDNEATILMGHTRWRTRGNEFNNRNNHPIRAGIVIGTHNGTIYNTDYLFRRLGLLRYAEVDSELIFRLADRFAPEGPIDQEGLNKALALCRGQMSAGLASPSTPAPSPCSRATNRSACASTATTGLCSTPQSPPLSTLPWTTRRAGASWRCRP